MRRLIATLVDHCNYGNRLQNYALEHLFDELIGCLSLRFSQRV